jgi:L-fuconolactonase
MDRNKVEHAILIQIRGQLDNSYQRDCVRRYPGRFASVVLADTCVQMEREAGEGAVGVRLRPDSSPDLWEAAARYGLAVSCAGSSAAFASEEFARLVRSVSSTSVVLEHYAGLEDLAGGRSREQGDSGDGHDPHAAFRDGVLELACLANVSVKLHGLGEFCVRAMPVDEQFPFVRPIPPLIPKLLEAFGPERLMWASDYPPVATREGYGLALRLVRDEVPPQYHEAVFGENAGRIFGPR